ncbi:hypothetical protein [Nonomuraea sp. NPDC046570]|uniref:hypothetical protein n=1 Tax=Nonomuraea sp. NPDC046570 TaxID=3155255 RepID=UPI0033D873D3
MRVEAVVLPALLGERRTIAKRRVGDPQHGTLPPRQQIEAQDLARSSIITHQLIGTQQPPRPHWIAGVLDCCDPMRATVPPRPHRTDRPAEAVTGVPPRHLIAYCAPSHQVINHVKALHAAR